MEKTKNIFKRLIPKSVSHISRIQDERRDLLTEQEKAEPLLEEIAEAKQSRYHGQKNNQSPVEEGWKEHTINEREIPENSPTAVIVDTGAADCNLILQQTYVEAGCQQVAVEKMTKDDRPRKKTSKEKHKVTKQTYATDDLNVTTQTSKPASECDPGTFLTMQYMPDSSDMLLEFKGIPSQQLRGINALQKEISSEAKQNSKIRKKIMGLDQEECKLRMNLQQDIEKFQTTEHLCKTPEKQLLQKEERNDEPVAESEQREKELENRRNELERVFKEQTDTQRQISQKETQRLAGHHCCNLENISLTLQKLISEVQEIKAQRHKQKKHQKSTLKYIVKMQAEMREELKTYIESMSQKLAQYANLTPEYDEEKFEQQYFELLMNRELLLHSSSETGRQDEACRNLGIRVEQEASTGSDLNSGPVSQCPCLAKSLCAMKHNRRFTASENRPDCRESTEQEFTTLLHSLDEEKQKQQDELGKKKTQKA